MVLLNFGDWWEGLSIVTRIYWMIAIPASIIFLIQLVVSFKEKKTETIIVNAYADVSIEKKEAITFQLINFRNFIGFFTSLGWSGLACIDSGLSLYFTLFVSIICGSIVMISMAIIFYFMSKLMKTVEEDM
jgi:hypothetical protein